jgi:hypothetical protein
MFAFVVYAVLAWYLAFKWRREWRGFGVVLLSLAGVALVAYFHICLNRWTNGRIYLPVLQVLLYPYGVLVGMVGVFLAVLPLRHKFSCRACGFELSGLESDNPRCPECGLEEAARPCPFGVCATCALELNEDEAEAGLCDRCAVRPPALPEPQGPVVDVGVRARVFVRERANSG